MADALPPPALRDLARRLGVVMQSMIADDMSDPRSDLRIRLVERVITLADIIATLRGAANRADEAHGDALAPTPSEEKTPSEETTPSEEKTPFEEEAPRKWTRRGSIALYVWTPERDALLREKFSTSTDDAALLAEINAAPGSVAVNSIRAMRHRASVLGIRRAPGIVGATQVRTGHASIEARRELGIGPLKWTAQRVDLLRADYPDSTDLRALLARANALPGDPIASVDAMRKKAEALGIERKAEAARMARGRRRGSGMPPPAAPAEEQAATDTRPAQDRATVRGSTAKAWTGNPSMGALLTVSADDNKSEAFDLFDAGMLVRQVAAEMGESLGTVVTWHAEWKAQSGGVENGHGG